MTLMILPLLAAVGMGAEASDWYLTHRASQNAADAAALAAAMNDCNPTASCHTSQLQPSYDQEAISVASKFGFANSGDTTVISSDSATCPLTGATTCYSVTVTHKVPVYLLQAVGFTGDTTTSTGAAAQTVQATAIAIKMPGSQYCVTAVGASSQAIRVNGGPNVHFENCDAYTPNGGSRCNGISGGGAFRSSYMTSPPNANPCPNPTPTAAPLVDNFDALKSSIPANSCSSYPGVLATTAADLAGKKCGTVTLKNDITVSADTALYIYNGQLDLAGHNLTTSGAAGMTIVFTGDSVSSGSGYSNNYTNSKNGSTSKLNISSPTSGTWSGVAIYQDPRLTGTKNTLDFTENKLDLLVSGLFYAKNANVTVSGNLTFSQSGKQCMALFLKSLLVNGSVNISTSQCGAQGLTGLPQAYNLAKLVA